LVLIGQEEGSCISAVVVNKRDEVSFQLWVTDIRGDEWATDIRMDELQRVRGAVAAALRYSSTVGLALKATLALVNVR
jgi:hypothetical protein